MISSEWCALVPPMSSHNYESPGITCRLQKMEFVTLFIGGRELFIEHNF